MNQIDRTHRRVRVGSARVELEAFLQNEPNRSQRKSSENRVGEAPSRFRARNSRAPVAKRTHCAAEKRTHRPRPATLTREGHVAMVPPMLLWILLALVPAPSVLAAQPAIKNVIVTFQDGTQQRVDAPAPAQDATTQPTAATQPTTQAAIKMVDPATAPPARRIEPFLGVNLEALRDYDRQFMFIDAMKTSRKFGSAKTPYDGKATIGPDGWPMDDAGTLVMTDVKNVNGVYHFFAGGKCDLSTLNSPARVQNLAYDAKRDRTYAEVVVAAESDKPITLSLAFKNTGGAGLRDIKLLRPGYDSDAQVFTGEFLLALHPFGAIRFMDYLRTNNSKVSKWAERCKPTDAQYSTEKGGPYETAIQLCNFAGKDAWLCVPALADDDFVRQLGQLVRDQLRPDLHCYFEYSNEVWNGQFQQYKQNKSAAQAEVSAGDQTLNDGGKDTNVEYWARKRIAKRAVEIKKLLGDDPRFRVILASQVGYQPAGGVLKMQLEYVEKYFGPPSQFFYAVAGAPYFSPGKDEADPAKKKWFTERDDITCDQICDRLMARTGTSANDNVKAFHALAAKYHLRTFAYEGGLDLQQFNKHLDMKIASQYDPRAGAAVEDYLNKWYSAGGDAMFYFDLSGRYTKSGYWGLTEDIRDLSAPKYQAAARVSKRLAETAATVGR